MSVKIRKIKEGKKEVEEIVVGEEPEGITYDTVHMVKKFKNV